MRRLRVRYPMRADRVIGLGEIPTVRLQRALGPPGEVRPHDTVLSAVHWVWFLVPHGTVAYMLLRHHEQFERAAVQIAGVFDLGLLVYWVVPTAPPWWAGRRPRTRAPDHGGGRARSSGEASGSRSTIRWAAIPSPRCRHSISPPRSGGPRAVGRRARAGHSAGPMRLDARASRLVYLGEHYVVDLIAGAGAGRGACRLGAPRRPACGPVAGAIQRLEPGRPDEPRARRRAHRRRRRADARRAGAAEAALSEARRRGVEERIAGMLSDRAQLGRWRFARHGADRRDLRAPAEGRRPRGRVPADRDADVVLDRHRVGFNVAAFGAYVALFRGVLGGAAPTRAIERLDCEGVVPDHDGGLAATRLFSAAGAGGIVLTYWALRKAGMPRRRAACRMVAFLVLLYTVYLLALIVFGVLLRTGVLPGDNPVGGTIVPAAVAGGGAGARRPARADPGRRRAAAAHRSPSAPRGCGCARSAAVPGHHGHAACAPRSTTCAHPRTGALAVGGAVGFWAANIGILWASFEAFGGDVPFARARAGLLRRDGRQPDPVAGRRASGSVDAGMIGAFAAVRRARARWSSRPC